MDEKQINSELNALINLLDEPDEFVFDKVKERFSVMALKPFLCLKMSGTRHMSILRCKNELRVSYMRYSLTMSLNCLANGKKRLNPTCSPEL